MRKIAQTRSAEKSAGLTGVRVLKNEETRAGDESKIGRMFDEPAARRKNFSNDSICAASTCKIPVDIFQRRRCIDGQAA